MNAIAYAVLGLFSLQVRTTSLGGSALTEQHTEESMVTGGDPNKVYICRVQDGNVRYGVLFSRSIGDSDAHKHLGLISSPEIRTGKLTQGQDLFMVRDLITQRLVELTFMALFGGDLLRPLFVSGAGV